MVGGRAARTRREQRVDLAPAIGALDARDVVGAHPGRCRRRLTVRHDAGLVVPSVERRIVVGPRLLCASAAGDVGRIWPLLLVIEAERVAELVDRDGCAVVGVEAHAIVEAVNRRVAAACLAGGQRRATCVAGQIADHHVNTRCAARASRGSVHGVGAIPAVEVDACMAPPRFLDRAPPRIAPGRTFGGGAARSAPRVFPAHVDVGAAGAGVGPVVVLVAVQRLFGEPHVFAHQLFGVASVTGLHHAAGQQRKGERGASQSSDVHVAGSLAFVCDERPQCRTRARTCTPYERARAFSPDAANTPCFEALARARIKLERRAMRSKVSKLGQRPAQRRQPGDASGDARSAGARRASWPHTARR